MTSLAHLELAIDDALAAVAKCQAEEGAAFDAYMAAVDRTARAERILADCRRQYHASRDAAAFQNLTRSLV